MNFKYSKRLMDHLISTHSGDIADFRTRFLPLEEIGIASINIEDTSSIKMRLGAEAKILYNAGIQSFDFSVMIRGKSKHDIHHRAILSAHELNLSGATSISELNSDYLKASQMVEVLIDNMREVFLKKLVKDRTERAKALYLT